MIFDDIVLKSDEYHSRELSWKFFFANMEILIFVNILIY